MAKTTMSTRRQQTRYPRESQAYFWNFPPAYGDAITENEKVVGYRVHCPYCQQWESIRTPGGGEGFVVLAECGRGLYAVFCDDVRRGIVEDVLEVAHI